MIFEDNANHTTNSTSCKVCGDKATINHYGALTCNSCKTFFSRYALKSELASQCLFRGECKINMQTRAVCLACRLKKCFKVGMDPVFIRKTNKTRKHGCSSNKNLNKQIVLASHRMLNTPLPTLSLLRQDRSTLTTFQWTILSNVVHAYDRFSPMTQMGHFIKEMSNLSIQSPSNSSYAFALLELVIKSTQVFIRSLPDFQVLTVPEQHSLLDRNLQGSGGLNSTFFARIFGLFENPQFKPTVESVHDIKTIVRLRRLTAELDPDFTLIKLLIVILSFSSNCLILNIPKNFRNDRLLSGTFRLYGSQNIYVELLWKYMLYRYGYRDTVIRFSYLIMKILDELNYLSQLYVDNKTPQLFISNAFNADNNSFVTDLDVNIPLWGNS